MIFSFSDIKNLIINLQSKMRKYNYVQQKIYHYLCLFGTCCFFAMPGSVYAQLGFTNYIFQRFEQGGRMAERLLLLEDGMDLSGLNLSCTFINRDNLYDYNKKATLKNIDFSRSNLIGSDLSETNFADCFFRRTSLGYVTAIGSIFTDCDFTDANIGESNIKLSKEQLVTTESYKHKELRGYQFQGNFSGVDFSNCDFTGASFISAELDGCDFSNAKISATALYHRIRPKTAISHRMTTEQLLSTKDFRQKCVLNVVFSGSHNIAKTEFSGMDFSETDFSGMNFTGCHFWYVNFHNTDFTNAVISDCEFVELETMPESSKLTLNQIKSTWNYKIGNMAGVVLPKRLQEQLETDRQFEGK